MYPTHPSASQFTIRDIVLSGTERDWSPGYVLFSAIFHVKIFDRLSENLSIFAYCFQSTVFPLCSERPSEFYLYLYRNGSIPHLASEDSIMRHQNERQVEWNSIRNSGSKVKRLLTQSQYSMLPVENHISSLFFVELRDWFWRSKYIPLSLSLRCATTVALCHLRSQ